MIALTTVAVVAASSSLLFFLLTTSVDPSGELTCQIVLEMPEVPPSFEVSFAYNLETTYNGELQTKNEILEILPDD